MSTEPDPAQAGPGPSLLEVGNIDLSNRSRAINRDGSVSTVRSIGIYDDGVYVVIPTVSPTGKILSDAAAIALYRKTGEHLGKFTNQATADAFAQALHNSEGQRLSASQPSLSMADIAEVARQMAGLPPSHQPTAVPTGGPNHPDYTDLAGTHPGVSVPFDVRLPPSPLWTGKK